MLKAVCKAWANIAQVIFFAMLAQIDRDKIIDYFPVEICFWTVGQHCLGNFLVQC